MYYFLIVQHRLKVLVVESPLNFTYKLVSNFDRIIIKLNQVHKIEKNIFENVRDANYFVANKIIKIASINSAL